MDEFKDSLFKFYEKLYFHEIDARAHLDTRVQTSFTLLIALCGVIGFMLQNYDKQSTATYLGLFMGFLVINIPLLAIAAFYLVKAWWGNVYTYIPTAQESDDHREELRQTYPDGSKHEKLQKTHMYQYLYDRFIECSSNNAEINQRRSGYFHQAHKALIAASFTIIISFFIFHFGNLSTSKENKISEVKIVQPIAVYGAEIDKR